MPAQIIWVSPSRCESPHSLTEYEKLHYLTAAFRASARWDPKEPALVGYRDGSGVVQLLSGTHRLRAALDAGLPWIPIHVYSRAEVEQAWGDVEAWQALMRAEAAGADGPDIALPW